MSSLLKECIMMRTECSEAGTDKNLILFYPKEISLQGSAILHTLVQLSRVLL